MFNRSLVGEWHATWIRWVSNHLKSGGNAQHFNCKILSEMKIKINEIQTDWHRHTCRLLPSAEKSPEVLPGTLSAEDGCGGCKSKAVSSSPGPWTRFTCRVAKLKGFCRLASAHRMSQQLVYRHGSSQYDLKLTKWLFHLHRNCGH